MSYNALTMSKCTTDYLSEFPLLIVVLERLALALEENLCNLKSLSMVLGLPVDLALMQYLYFLQ